MKDFLTDFYNKVLTFFQTEKVEGENTKETAKNRLKLVLMQDRSNLEPETMAQLREELIEVISKYIVIDKEALGLNLDGDGESMALMLNIPVIRAKKPEEIQEALEAAKKAKEEAEEAEKAKAEEDAEAEDASEEIAEETVIEGNSEEETTVEFSEGSADEIECECCGECTCGCQDGGECTCDTEENSETSEVEEKAEAEQQPATEEENVAVEETFDTFKEKPAQSSKKKKNNKQ